MTDDFDATMAQRLADAGDRWRAAHETAAAMNDEVFDATGAPIDIVMAPAPRRRWWTGWAVGISSVAAAAVAVFIAVNLQGGNNNPGTEVGDTGGAGIQGQWLLRSMADSDGHGVRVIEPAPLQFTDATIGGTDGCNHIGASVTIGADSFDLGQGLATTDMACVDRPAGFDEQVQLIHSVLTGSVNWSITGELLTLTGPTGAKLVFARDTDAGPITDPRAILGTWTLDTIGTDGPDGTASSALPYSDGKLPTIQFTPDGKYSVDDGCNYGSGTVTIEPGLLALSDRTSTLVACPDNVQAAKMAVVLNGDVVWSIKNGQLTITKKNVGYLVFGQVASQPGQGNVPTDAPDSPTATGTGGSDPGSSGGGSKGSTGEPAATASDLPLHT